jgi:hypothetical protein
LLLYLTNVSQSDLEQKVEAGILDKDKTYRGLAYGHYLSEWLKWLHSDTPIYRGYPREICYLSGNNSFVYDKETGKRKQSEPFHNKAGNVDGTYRGLTIYQDTAIFVPIHAAYYSVGERHYYNGDVLRSIADCQFICRRDMDEGFSRYITLQKMGEEKEIDLFKHVCYIESPSFSLTVTENSPMREHIEMPIEPGTYDETFVAAYGIMLNTSDASENSLPEGEYRIRHGMIGCADYKSDSVQDLIVRSRSTVLKPPVSKPKLGGPPKFPLYGTLRGTIDKTITPFEPESTSNDKNEN